MAVLSAHSDRRASPRLAPSQVPQIREIKINSEAVKVINISRGGLLADCSIRLEPQRPIRIKVDSVWVSCRVVRCRVIAVSAETIKYQAGLIFDSALDIAGLEPALDAEPVIFGGAQLGGWMESTRMEAAFSANSW
jgi:hypothetical protein